jgi:hypothetical protein
MFLYLIKILLWFAAIRYSIALVSYHINHVKKTKHRGGGNRRMPKDVELALNALQESYLNGTHYLKYCVPNQEVSPTEQTAENSTIFPENLNFNPVPHQPHTNSNSKETMAFPKLETGNPFVLFHSKFNTALTANYMANNNSYNGLHHKSNLKIFKKSQACYPNSIWHAWGK